MARIDREADVPPEDLHVDGENPNEQDEDTFADLKRGLRSDGWLGGDIVANTGDLPGYDGDPEGLICDGEHRWRAAQDLGRDTVPVKFVDFEDDAERRLWRQRLNKTTGEHDRKRDGLEVDAILSHGGYTEELESVMDAAGQTIDELLAEIRVETSTQPAYEYDPDHNVYFEDCVEGMRERLSDDSVDCVITDPPYGIDVDLENAPETTNQVRKSHQIAADKNVDDAIQLFSACLTELHRVLKDDGHLYVFCSWKTYGEFKTAIEASGFEPKSCIVWEKTDPNAMPSWSDARFRYAHEFILFCTKADAEPRRLDGTPKDVIEYEDAQHADNNSHQSPHPTQKPTGLISKFINYSTDPGDTVMDPFMGSGTTAVAAIQNDRDYVGFEIDAENYRDVIERRIGEAKRQREASVNQDQEAGADD